MAPSSRPRRRVAPPTLWVGLTLCWAATAPIACDSDDEPLEPLVHGTAIEICKPGEARVCYSGPPETEGVGSCQAGVQQCASHGRAWGLCQDEVRPAPEDCQTTADENCDGLVSCGHTVWNLRVGAEWDEAVTRVATDAEGNVYITGQYVLETNIGGELPLPAQEDVRDVFVAKYDGDGVYQWGVGFYGDIDDVARDVAVGPGGQVAMIASVRGTVQHAGDSSSGAGGYDVFVALLDADGSVLWTRRYGDDAHQHPLAVAFDSTGDLLLTGGFAGDMAVGGVTLEATGGDYDVFAVKLAPNGTPRWATSFPALRHQLAYALALDQDDAIYLAGSFEGSMKFEGDSLAASGDESDVLIVKLGPDGGYRWSQSLAGAGADIAHAMAVDSRGDVIVVGRFDDRLQVGRAELTAPTKRAMFVAKLDEVGEPQWGRGFGGLSTQAAYDVDVDSRDRIVVAGYYEGEVTIGESTLPTSGLFEPNILVTKLEPDGEPVWSRGVPVSGSQSSPAVEHGWRSLAVTAGDFILLGGTVSGPIDFGGGPLEGFGLSDIFIAKLAP